jgi:hypothetical protein
MELDEIKILLKQKLEEDSPLQSAPALMSPGGKRSRSVISKIKRNIWLEFAAVQVCMAVAVWMWIIYTSLPAHFFCIATWIFSFIFCGYLYALYRKIIFYETVQSSVKENLQQVILIVKRFTQLYFRISMGLLPVIFVFGLIAGYMDISQQRLLQQFHWSKGLIFYSIFFTGWSVLIYFFAKWYIRKLYRNYLLQLQQQLKDIENG